MRGLALVATFGLAACANAAKAPRQDASVDEASDGSESGDDAPDPFMCATIGSIVLSNPTITAGVAAPGQTATLTITMSDTNPNGYVSYPGIVLVTSTPGITLVAQSGPPGSLIDGTMSKPVPFVLTFDASIPSGTRAGFAARAYGWGHTAPDCPNAFLLAFPLTLQ